MMIALNRSSKMKKNFFANPTYLSEQCLCFVFMYSHMFTYQYIFFISEVSGGGGGGVKM